MESENYAGRYLAVLLNEDDDSESIIAGMCVTDEEDYLVLAYYLRKQSNGTAAKEVTISKDYIRQIVVLEKRKEPNYDNPQQLQLSFDGPTQAYVAEAAA